MSSRRAESGRLVMSPPEGFPLAGAAAVGQGSESSGGVTSDIVRFLSWAGLHWRAKVAQLLSGSSIHYRLVAVRAELIQHRLLISDKGGKLLVGGLALAVILNSSQRVDDG